MRIVHQTDAERQWAYDRTSSGGIHSYPAPANGTIWQDTDSAPAVDVNVLPFLAPHGGGVIDVMERKELIIRRAPLVVIAAGGRS